LLTALAVGAVSVPARPLLAETPPAHAARPAAAAILINEVDSDTPGADAAEFVELYDGGAGHTDLTGLVVVFFNGNGDTSYAAYDLDGKRTGAAGYFLLGNKGVVPAADLTFSDGLLQNGADAVALYEANAADFPGGSPVTVERLIDAIVYDTSDADDPGLLALLNPGEPQVNENAGSASAEDSVQRCPNAAGGPRTSSAYASFGPSPGAPNACSYPPAAIADLAASITPARKLGLEWAAVTHDTRGNAIAGVTYNVYRGQDDPYFAAGAPYAASLAAPSFTDPAPDVVGNAARGTYYFVSGVHNGLVGAPSKRVAAFAFRLKARGD
jgi:hypothetical protein